MNSAHKSDHIISSHKKPQCVEKQNYLRQVSKVGIHLTNGTTILNTNILSLSHHPLSHHCPLTPSPPHTISLTPSPLTPSPSHHPLSHHLPLTTYRKLHVDCQANHMMLWVWPTRTRPSPPATVREQFMSEHRTEVQTLVGPLLILIRAHCSLGHNVRTLTLQNSS